MLKDLLRTPDLAPGDIQLLLEPIAFVAGFSGSVVGAVTMWFAT